MVSSFYTKKDANGEYVLRKDPTQEITKALGPYKTKTELIQQKDQEIEQTDEAIAELDKQLQEYQEVIDNENEETAVRERALLLVYL